MLRRVLLVFFTIILFSYSFSIVSFAEGKVSIDFDGREDNKQTKDSIVKEQKEKKPKKMRVIETEDITAYARTLYTTVDSPDNHESGNLFDGVARLSLPSSDGNTYICSGSLLSTGKHVLTAAHCVTDSNGVLNLLSGGTATFLGTFGTEIIGISGVTVHNSFDGDFLKGNDIAILELSSVASSGVIRYDYATNDNSVDQVLQKIGYGISGKFKTGDDPNQYPPGTKRDGQNKYDAFADVMYQVLNMQPITDENPLGDYLPQAVYQYDSDNGQSKNDAFDFFFNIPNLGLGNNEVISAGGDSGGPTLSDTNDDGALDTVVGITSYGITLQYSNGKSSDCTKQNGPFGSVILDSSCGEFAGDTRVSSYTAFIVGVIDPLDLDGIIESNDNCPSISNPGQEDGDADQIGDVCDALPLEPNKQCVNQTGDWNDANSWIPAGNPVSTERIVLINCTLTIPSTLTVNVNNFVDVDSTSIINNEGTLNANSNSILVSGIYNVLSGGTHNINTAGFTNILSGGTFDVQSGGTVNEAGQYTTQTGGTTKVSGQWNQQGTKNKIFGTFSVEPSGNYNNQAGGTTRNVSGSFTVQNGGIMIDSGTFVTEAGQTTTVSGIWNAKSGAWHAILGTFSVASGGVYTNEANAFTNILSGGNFNLQTDGKINNFGTFTVKTGGITTLDDDYDNNTGGKTKNFGTMNQSCNGVFNELGGIFTGTPIVDICL